MRKLRRIIALLLLLLGNLALVPPASPAPPLVLAAQCFALAKSRPANPGRLCPSYNQWSIKTVIIKPGAAYIRLHDGVNTHTCQATGIGALWAVDYVLQTAVGCVQPLQ